jgi:NtrC-family two-component system response regulator AlgB
MKLLLIADEQKLRRMLAWGFAAEPYRVKLACTRQAVEERIKTESFQAACIDWKAHAEAAADIAQFLHARLPGLPIIALVAEKDRNRTSNLKSFGVTAHVVSPYPIEKLHALLREHALLEAVPPIPQPEDVRVPAAPAAGLAQLTTYDQTARRTLEMAVRAAKSNAAILILGDTGTGKSLLARIIHDNSALSGKPFVTVNCPCLSQDLLESGLFGHVRGAFTGAIQDTWGKVAAAEGGTLFLDEIGDLPMSLQPKLLRLLQEKQYERVGETTPRRANVRILAATNRNLKAEVASGRFREDLYYRLNVITIDVPPLRGRPIQIMGAAESFLAGVCRELGKRKPAFDVESRRLFENHAWPGNLRELRNVVERAAILSTGAGLEAGDFPTLLTAIAPAQYQIGGAISLKTLENAHIQMVVANSSSLEEAAQILGIDKSTLYRKRRQMKEAIAQFEAVVESTPEPVAATAT